MSEREEEFASIFGIKYITGRSIQEALEESVSGETFLFVTTCGFLLYKSFTIQGYLGGRGGVCCQTSSSVLFSLFSRPRAGLATV